MQLTLTDIIAYVRKLDERLRDTVKFTDDDIADKIKYGIDNLSAQVQPFAKEEFVDLKQFIDAGITKILFKPSEQNLGYYSKSFWKLVGFDWVQVDSYTNITVTENKDRSLLIDILSVPAEQLALKVEYFFAPDIVSTPILEVEPEVWHFMKHSIQIVVWGALKDYEKEQYHQKVLDEHASKKILQSPTGYVPTTMKGGFV